MQAQDRSAAASAEPEMRRPLWRSWLARGAALALALALLAAPPHGLLDKADRYAYAVCHRMAGHSIFVGGRQLPLCARCSGSYLGALAGLVVLLALGRGRANRFPPRRFWPILGLCMAAWAADGLNSYLTLFPELPHLYEPSNLLRLITGTLEGLVIAALILPLFNLSVWAAGAAQPVIHRWRDFGWLLVGAAAVIAALGSEWPPLLYPLAVASAAMVVFLIGLLCGVVVLIVTRRDGRLASWRQAAWPLLAGLALTLAGLAAIALARDVLTVALGLPF
jgi:uncharacterized membrane protein